MKSLSHRLFNQTATEQATGLSREVLRKWEQCYGFPNPQRGDRGQRLYSDADIQRLLLIQRLTVLGVRPARLVDATADELAVTLDNQLQMHDDSDLSEMATSLLASLDSTRPVEQLLAVLEQGVRRGGLADFVDRQLPALNQAVGDAWAEGQISVYAEHRYSECIQQLLHRHIAALPRSAQRPAVLVTTPPGELHGLGVLGLKAALMLGGADCIGLGTQTPVSEVGGAVHAHEIAAVAISMSAFLREPKVRRYAQELRQELPASCALWLGGQGAQCLAADPPTGVQVFQQCRQAVQAWRDLARPTRTSPAA